jgi:hypothetical protein
MLWRPCLVLDGRKEETIFDGGAVGDVDEIEALDEEFSSVKVTS